MKALLFRAGSQLMLYQSHAKELALICIKIAKLINYFNY